jgi:signal transduction histidine kinase
MNSKTTSPKDIVLIVDDILENVSVLFRFLSQEGFKVLVAQNGEQALRIFDLTRPDIILLDVMMPGMSGFEVCQKLKSQEQTQNIPIIFMTALSDTVDKVQGFSLGAADYITKPFQHEEVLVRVNAHLNLHKLQKKLEKQNIKLQQQNQTLETLVQALQQTKLTAEATNVTKKQFLANISHELRTPMNAIIGYSEMLKEEAEQSQAQYFSKDLEKILEAGHHLLEMINDILDFSKLEAGKMELSLETFGIYSMLNDLVNAFEPLTKNNLNSLEIVCPKDIGIMHSDISKVRRILLNLLNNANQFTQQGSIKLTVSKTIDWISFAVSDTGIGISPEQQQQIFSSFTQVDNSSTRQHGGTGLGLSITKRFVEILQGHLKIESQLEHGSTFTVLLPST